MIWIKFFNNANSKLMTYSNLKTVGARRSMIDELISIKSKVVCVCLWAKGLKGELSTVQWREKGACTFFQPNEKPGSEGTSSYISWKELNQHTL